MRNDLYAAHPFASKAMVIMQPNMDDARARTNTGHARISEIHHRGRWLFRVQHLDVGTGRRMARAFSYNTTARPVSREEALREALRFREDNAEAVAPIILEYNARVQEAFEELAELEVADLTPRLHTLQGFSLKRWMESREAAWAVSGGGCVPVFSTVHEPVPPTL
ncbi:hypothetical protein [Thioalkalivibrio sp. K90mix]|uniref:hypothetical protein n=1 Tax=Thioalkalivibrio sp. (strain K90mix) TaxID=396595 RepID=UPI000195A561|nr:hypothetical protein [Thioalkalivibrio sp. K90mix]